MAKAKKSKEKAGLAAEEREAVGKWARRVSQSVREFEKATGKKISDDEFRPWHQMSEEDRELYRKGGEAVASGVLMSEQAMWNQMGRIRTEMGEKAFRQKMFGICIDIAVERLAPHLSELERYKAAQAIVGLSGMLEVPPDAAAARQAE